MSDRRTSITDPLGNVTQFTYNALGKVLTTTDPLGHVTTNTYNAAGNLLTTRDALNNTTSFGYSVFDGQRTSMTDALGNITSYTYTGGYLTKETDALGHETTFTYDANGNRGSQTVKRTNALGQLETITTAFEYDKLNRLRKTTFAGGTFTEAEYNSIGQQSATIDQLGRRTEFTYDDMGRLTKTTFADAAFEETTYDAEGRRLTSKDRAGNVTAYTYDELGRLTKTTYADGTFAQTSYDSLSQALTTTDARGNVTRYFYDDAGHRTKVKNALNQETTFTYDRNSNQLSMTDALGHTTSYEYDLDNRRTKTTYADATFASVAYDALGRTVSRTDQAGKTSQFTYDASGRLTRVKDALNQETTYAYDELGRQISQTDANNHTTRFEYDQLGRRLKRILPAGQFETYSYQSDGNLQSRTDFNGKTTTFAYDLMRRLLTKVPDPSLNQPTVSFTYNSAGQRSTMNDASGMTAYSYDLRNRLTSKQTPFGSLSYTYNQVGSLATIRSSNPNGVSVDYSYDPLNRLETVKDNNLPALNGGVTNYTYDSVGNLQGYSYPNGVTSSYSYNSLNRLTTMTVGTTGSSLASYAYTLGPTGNRTSVTESSGRTVNYSYDDLYRLSGETITNDPHGINGSANYSYDPVGNRLNRSSSIAPVPSQSSTYDANDRLTGDSYDNNGNTISAGGNSYTYDFENHLTTLNSGSVTYAYDGDGKRVAKTVGSVTTNYLIDTNNPTGYTQVVEELQSGAVVKSFTYGHDLISQRCSPITANCSLSFYQYDGHGSVRQLTNASGSVTDAYDYDAFGNLISRTGTTSNDYLYAGEQFDANLGFYYLRARYMNPASGRFLSTDVVEGNRFDPPTLHKYTYVENNPANLVDPRGEFSATESLASVVSSAISLSIQYQSLINAARLILAGLNLYLLATNETYRGNFLAGGPEFTSAAVADDLGSIAAAPARFSGSVFEASRLEPFAVRHATNYPQSVIDGIDPTRLNINSRLGPAFYVAEDGQTAVNEVISHEGTFTHIVRYEMNLSGQRVLDFTNPRVARTWGYSSTLSYDRTQMIAQQAARQRYTVIAYPAVQGAGTNFAVLKNFTEILRPMGVAPGP
jgi:RHS repeat-associated protein